MARTTINLATAITAATIAAEVHHRFFHQQSPPQSSLWAQLFAYPSPKLGFEPDSARLAPNPKLNVFHGLIIHIHTHTSYALHTYTLHMLVQSLIYTHT